MKSSTLVAAMLLLAACGGNQTEIQNITGTGATFPDPIYSKWFDAYRQMHPGIQINYQPSGSGAGVSQVTEGTVDFGASDQPLTDEQVNAFQERRGSRILHFPTVIGAVVPTYNLPGVTEPLNFTPEVLAGVFLGKITKWNDPAIASVNPGAALPAADIVVVHRSDGSGTTYVWTDYLAKVSPEWAQSPGRGTSISWPVGVGGKGNAGVAGFVKQNHNSLGYVELNYAEQNGMAVGRVRNRSGEFVEPALEAVVAAAAEIEMPEDFRVSITDPPGKNAYPIASFTWLLIPEQMPDPNKKMALYDFLEWMLGEGQAMTSALAYAPLPPGVIEKEKSVLASLR